MKTSWQIKVSTSKPVPNLFRQTAAALMLAILLSPAVWAAPVQSDRPQTLASSDAVPEGLRAPEWSSIRQQFEQQRHAAYPVTGGYQARNPGQHWQTRFDLMAVASQPSPKGPPSNGDWNSRATVFPARNERSRISRA